MANKKPAKSYPATIARLTRETAKYSPERQEVLAQLMLGLIRLVRELLQGRPPPAP